MVDSGMAVPVVFTKPQIAVTAISREIVKPAARDAWNGPACATLIRHCANSELRQAV